MVIQNLDCLLLLVAIAKTPRVMKTSSTTMNYTLLATSAFGRFLPIEAVRRRSTLSQLVGSRKSIPVALKGGDPLTP